jgi:hypothetical protein
MKMDGNIHHNAAISLTDPETLLHAPFRSATIFSTNQPNFFVARITAALLPSP